jgi:hypothetical protein
VPFCFENRCRWRRGKGISILAPAGRLWERALHRRRGTEMALLEVDVEITQSNCKHTSHNDYMCKGFVQELNMDLYACFSDWGLETQEVNNTQSKKAKWGARMQA